MSSGLVKSDAIEILSRNKELETEQVDYSSLNRDETVDVKAFMQMFKSEVEVKILEDNRYLLSEQTFKNIQIVFKKLLERNIKFQGFGTREFYISIDSNEYTVLVENFEYDTEIEGL